VTLVPELQCLLLTIAIGGDAGRQEPPN